MASAKLSQIVKCGVVLSLSLLTFSVLADDCPPQERGWSVKICPHPDPNESGDIGFDVGFGGVESSRRFWRDWHAGEPREFLLPVDLRHANEIYIKSWTNDKWPDGEGKNVSICYLFNGHVTEVHRHDHEEEDETSRDDNETGDCQCN